MRRRPSVQKAFDEVRFGTTRILNLREGLPTGSQAVQRAEGWLRAKQIERVREVLVVTGRGNGSLAGLPVIRTEIQRLLSRLRRAGVVGQVQEHTPGSVVVTLAPLRALFEAASRDTRAKERPGRGLTAVAPPALAALDPGTRAALHRLAIRGLETLGVRTPTKLMVDGEMNRQFALLIGAIRHAEFSEQAFTAAVERAVDEYDEEGN